MAKTKPRLPTMFEPRFLEEADGRRRIVRDLRKRVERLMEHAAVDSYQKELLARRAVFMAVQLETWETMAMEGQQIDFAVYTQGLNTLSGLLNKLGLERREDFDRLNEYMEGKAKDDNKRALDAYLNGRKR